LILRIGANLALFLKKKQQGILFLQLIQSIEIDRRKKTNQSKVHREISEIEKQKNRNLNSTKDNIKVKTQKKMVLQPSKRAHWSHNCVRL